MLLSAHLQGPLTMLALDMGQNQVVQMYYCGERDLMPSLRSGLDRFNAKFFSGNIIRLAWTYDAFEGYSNNSAMINCDNHPKV